MKVAVKFLILIFGFIAGAYTLRDGYIGAGIASAGAFIAFALIEVQELRIHNEKDED